MAWTTLRIRKQKGKEREKKKSVPTSLAGVTVLSCRVVGNRAPCGYEIPHSELKEDGGDIGPSYLDKAS